MRHWVHYALTVVALVGVVLFVGPKLSAQRGASRATNVPVIPHESVPDFFKNPPGIYTGENMGIATNSKGNVYAADLLIGELTNWRVQRVTLMP